MCLPRVLAQASSLMASQKLNQRTSMPSIVQTNKPTAFDSSAKVQRGTLESLLSNPLAPFAVTFGFVAILLVWTSFDHALPHHDAAWHSSYSTAVKQWLIRPKGWSLQSLQAILTMQPNYPAASWFFNGICKSILGDSLLSEHIILAIHLCILNASTWILVKLLLKDRFKATLTLVFLDCSPLILSLQRVPYIDLLHTAIFSLYLCSLVWWWQNRNFKRALVCGIIFGIDCASKQIAVLYSVPCLLVYAGILLYQRKWRDLPQVVLIGLCGITLLLSWVIPNFHDLTRYTHNRTSLASQRIGVLQGICRNIQMAVDQIAQSFSPLLIAMLTLSSRWSQRQDFAATWPIFFAPFTGALAMISLAFFNLPETRYFGPVMLPLALALAMCIANFCRQAQGSKIVATLIALCIIQSVAICFQKCPTVTFPTPRNLSPVYAWLGLRDPALTCTLSYKAEGDPWKQEWLFNYIEEAEKRIRPVYLNVLPNSPEFNQGTMLCLSRMRHSCVCPTTWRCSMPDVTDSFKCSDQELHFMQWVVLKTGDQYCPWFDEASKSNYQAVVDKLQHDGQFIQAAQQQLPDGTELHLYQNKFWMYDHSAIPNAPKAAVH